MGSLPCNAGDMVDPRSGGLGSHMRAAAKPTHHNTLQQLFVCNKKALLFIILFIYKEDRKKA